MIAKARRSSLVASALVALVALASGCKQGIGQRCEVPDDCASGLCSVTQMVCESPNTIVPDASLARDALNIPDAGFIPDAGPPRVFDARPLPDAPPDIDAPDAPGSLDAPIVIDAG